MAYGVESELPKEYEPLTHDPYGQVALKMLAALADEAEMVAGFASEKLATLIDQNTVLDGDVEEKTAEMWPQFFAQMRKDTSRIADQLASIKRSIEKVEV